MRIALSRWLFLLLLLPVTGCSDSEPVVKQAAAPPTAAKQDESNSPLVAQIDAALAKAGKYLTDAQAEDGAWYSDHYGTLRSGPTMTPYVMSAILFLRSTGGAKGEAFMRGNRFLRSFVGQDGKLDVAERQLHYQVYTAAMASRVAAHPKPTGAKQSRTQQAYLQFLAARQLTEPLGWQPSDAYYGGWGFTNGKPRKPEEGSEGGPFCSSNLSATTFALAAFRSARVPKEDPVYAKALQFVQRCQNFQPSANNDGGFFFMPIDNAQNKAGATEDGKSFASYGTMTADGLRCLIRCGLPATHPRVQASRRWLAKNFSATENPGNFQPDRLQLKDATYYYWVWAFSHAMIALRVERLEKVTETGDEVKDAVDWPRELASELLRRQRPDGTWVNELSAGMEDDPLVATPWAAAALAVCRAFLTRELGPCKR